MSKVTEMIRLENVSKDYSMDKIIVHTLRDISLSVNKEEFVVVLGPGGSGKTTMLTLIGALDTPTSGRVKSGQQRNIRTVQRGENNVQSRVNRLRLPVSQSVSNPHSPRRRRIRHRPHNQRQEGASKNSAEIPHNGRLQRRNEQLSSPAERRHFGETNGVIRTRLELKIELKNNVSSENFIINIRQSFTCFSLRHCK